MHVKERFANQNPNVKHKKRPFTSKDWTIKEEYLNENSEIVGKYMTTMTKLKSIEQEIAKIKSETTNESKLKNIEIFFRKVYIYSI